MPDVLRLAMWSGPRNVSTALMRSFDARDDSLVCDEPLYAHYLERTGLAHPLAAEVVAAHEADWREVAAWLTGPVPPGTRVFYQKHMAHHLLPGIERGWLDALTHAFLIRDPAAMLASLVQVLPAPRLEHTGLPQQVELFERLAERDGRAPPVIDSADLLRDPAGVLGALCEAVGLPFQQAMLSWAPGPRETDGCWGPRWYANTWASTGFAPYTPRVVEPPPELRDVHAECVELHARLHAWRLGA